jgi:hypothetical protein
MEPTVTKAARKDCRFYDSENARKGFCRRRAPIAHANAPGEWPAVFQCEWCGEFEQKPTDTEDKKQ